MDIETSGAVKLFFPNPSLMLVYYEAVANSLDAGATKISIDVEMDAFDKPDSLKLSISDNGSGFNDENFSRFKTLLKPRDEFHKGIGRLVFLNYFKSISVDSCWGDGCRRFIFKEGFDGNSSVYDLGEPTGLKTTLLFYGFHKSRVKSYDHIKPHSIKAMIEEHFLPTFLSMKNGGKNFEIKISLKVKESNKQRSFFDSDAVITKDDLPVFSKAKIEDDLFDTFSGVDVSYNIQPFSDKGGALTAFSIDGRTIPVNLIPASAFPVGYKCIFIFESEIFNSAADSSRQKVLLPDSIPEAILYAALRRKVGEILEEEIPDIKQRNRSTREKFENQFPHLLGFFEKETVGLINKDDALHMAQQKFFSAEKEILQCEELSDRTYEKSLELSSRVLTEYILYREKIIRRMGVMNEKNKESDIHNLIVPRYQEFEGRDPAGLYQNNAWLLDDKFMVFRTILSEKRMDSVIQAIETESDCVDGGRPDIAMIFSADPDDSKPVDVVVVEIKKKTEDEKENQYAINQLLDRALKLVHHCTNIQRIWYYAVLHVSETMAIRLQQQKWAPLYSKGKVFYQDFTTPHPNGGSVPTPTFVMSFDAIVADAESRNHIFLEMLREGMKRYAADAG